MPSALKSRLAALERLSGRAWRCGLLFLHPDGSRYFAGGREVTESEWRGGMHQPGRAVKVYAGFRWEDV
jgi:hypothetical protein